MISKYISWLSVTVICALALPSLVDNCSSWMTGQLPIWQAALMGLCIVVFVGCAVSSAKKYAPKLTAFIETEATNQASFLNSLSLRRVTLAIIVSAALSLFLELTLIRWQASVFEFFAFYKNFSLLACLAGLGTGYALAGFPGLPIALSIPILGFEILLLLVIRYGLAAGSVSLSTTPITEQLSMGLSIGITSAELLAVYSLLAVTFILTVLALIPIGQLCGRLMIRTNSLSAYGFNLLGSLLGIILITLISHLATPPVVWFSIVFLAIIVFCANRKVLLIASTAALISLVALSWPVRFGYEVIYSPYQILERGVDAHGWSMIRAAGHYYQRMQDLTKHTRLAYPDLERKGIYYDLPYSVNPNAKSIAILGAGSGNDVAAALRSNAKSIDAIEIDPMILALGKIYHPERPYWSERVTPIVNDARAHLRNTKKNYDMIVFGLLDSHSLSSHISSLRIDSYVYTLEALREARAHLNENGVLCLSFSFSTPELAKKFYLMMKEAFGAPPICLSQINSYDGAITFLQNKNGTLQIPNALLKANHTYDWTKFIRQSDPPKTALSTDDWPFIYMIQREWPVSYMPMILLVIGATYAINRSLARHSNSIVDLDFFMLGAGFMLIEAKAITELGLVFGNTWYVVAIVISAIIFMAYLSNLFVEKLHFNKSAIAYMLLILSLAGGLYTTCSGGFASDTLGRIASVVTLTCPLIFSGIVFSSLISKCESLPRAMSMNLLGAMLGGMLEYNAMFLGYRALYVLAIMIYIIAFVCTRLRKESAKNSSPALSPD